MKHAWRYEGVAAGGRGTPSICISIGELGLVEEGAWTLCLELPTLPARAMNDDSTRNALPLPRPQRTPFSLRLLLSPRPLFLSFFFTLLRAHAVCWRMDARPA
jgi:hypothetical protein